VRKYAHRALKKFESPAATEAIEAFKRKADKEREKGLQKREQRLQKAERTDATFKVICENCGRVCIAKGIPLSPEMVPVVDLKTARVIGRYCKKCKIVVCGACSGVPQYQAGDRAFSATCPRCGGSVEYAAAQHVRRTKARVV
jgi:hypothetical protein